MIPDFYELLGRGIVAARTQRYVEAQKYLRLAAKTDPHNVRVWLWLAASVQTTDQASILLKEALRIDPNLTVAKILLGRLDKQAVMVAPQSSVFSIFTCQNCGGKQRFDPDVIGMVCEYCKTVETLEAKDASDAEAPLALALSKEMGNWAIGGNQVKCEACGAVLAISAERSTHACPFCGSEHIVIQSAIPGLLSPSAIAPFQLHTEDLTNMLSKWWKFPVSQFAHFLDTKKIVLSAIYLPFWTFDGRVQIRCALNRSVPLHEYSRTERVIEKWDGGMAKRWFECDIDDALVYAARSVPTEAIEKIAPFDLKSLLAYRPEMLVGWQAELYQITLEDSAVVAHTQMRDQAFKKAAKRSLFIEPAHMMQGDVIILDRMCKLILVPVWIGKMKNDGSSFLAFINGQTGKIFGERKSGWTHIFRL